MERNNLICCLVGWYSAKNPNITADDLRITIDQHLTESQMSTLGTEDGDVQLMQDLLDETIFSVFGRHVNRKQRRAGGIIKGKK